MSEGYVRSTKDHHFTPGDGGHGDVPRGFMAGLDAACREFLERRGLRTPYEKECTERMNRRNTEKKSRR